MPLGAAVAQSRACGEDQAANTRRKSDSPKLLTATLTLCDDFVTGFDVPLARNSGLRQTTRIDLFERAYPTTTVAVKQPAPRPDYHPPPRARIWCASPVHLKHLVFSLCDEFVTAIVNARKYGGVRARRLRAPGTARLRSIRRLRTTHQVPDRRTPWSPRSAWPIRATILPRS